MGDYQKQWQAANPDKVYVSGLSCSLCDWPAHVRGGTIADMSAALDAHQQSHPEWAEYQASIPSIRDIVDEVHKNCKHDSVQCSCACGCTERLGCTCWSNVCVQCQMNWMRGRDPEPGRLDCDAGTAAEPSENGQ